MLVPGARDLVDLHALTQAAILTALERRATGNLSAQPLNLPVLHLRPHSASTRAR